MAAGYDKKEKKKSRCLATAVYVITDAIAAASGTSTRAPTFDTTMFVPFPPQRSRAGANEQNARLRMNAEMKCQRSRRR